MGGTYVSGMDRQKLSRRKRVEKIEQNQVQEQHFDGGQAATGGPRTPEQLLAYLGNNPDSDITPDQIKILNDAGFGQVT